MTSKMKVNILMICLLPYLTVIAEDAKAKSRKQENASVKLPPCGACSALVDSFQKGMDRTARGKFEGGDAAWEEKNQGKGYASSEVRLVEIQEGLCKDVVRGELQCHSNHHNWEEHMEEWWKLEMDPKPSLHQWLCIDKLQVCCPDLHFGPKCLPCSLIDAQGNLCSGNGKCKGSGTRKGNGKCSCDKGYSGEVCDQCSVGFYQSYKDEDKNLCSPCHKSCQSHCTGSGAKACAACKAGYKMDTEHGCVDIDECLISKPCAGNKFCINTEGTYRCMSCDKACNGCDGDGPDNCLKCAEGYVKSQDDNLCISEQTAGKIFTISNTRFFTYGGLCIAACIIFQRSVTVAGILGVIIAVYITLSEYYLQGATGELRPMGEL